MPIHTAVIPVAGFGTRMLPAAKAVPKELLPILNQPTLQYVVEEGFSAGITRFILVTSKEKPAIARHFKFDAILDERLRKSGREMLLAGLNKVIKHAEFVSVSQEEQLGLGHAILQAKTAVGKQPFLCMLGDTVFSLLNGIRGSKLPARQLIRVHERRRTAIIGLEQVPPDKVNRYGIVSGESVGEGVLKLNGLVEKPSPQEAPSNFAIAARYILTPAIFECLDNTAPGKGGEIQLTDALQLLLKREPIHGVVLKSKRHDIGNPIDWLKTNLIFAARDPKLWEQIRPTIESLLGARKIY